MVASANAGLNALIRKAAEEGDIQRADITCRGLLAQDGSDAELLLLMADLAARLGRHVIRSEYIDLARSVGAIVSVPQGAPPPNRSHELSRYLVAIEWGYGFWADVKHVLGSLMLAEMSERVPLVYWGDTSLFSQQDGTNAWTRYFLPIGPEPAQLPNAEATYFPSPWTADRLLAGSLTKARQQRARGMHGLALLPRPETVVVSDTFVGVNDLWLWQEPGNVDYGRSLVETKRRLAKKYLLLQPHLSSRIDAFEAQHMRGANWIGVHMRGSDKAAELANLRQLNTLYFDEIDRRIQRQPDLRIFLLTDSAPDHAAMLDRYGARVLSTDAVRAAGNIGVHYSGEDPVKVAEQVIVDTYLASRCDEFLGNGSSNVSLAVEYLKPWAKDTYHLLGPDWRSVRFAI